MAQETIDFPSQFPDKANPDYRDVILGYDSQSGDPISVRLETLQANSATNIIGVAHPSDSPTGTETNGQGYDVSNTKAVPDPDDGSNDDTYTNFLTNVPDGSGGFLPVVVPASASGVIRKSGGSWEFVETAIDTSALVKKSSVKTKIYGNQLFDKNGIISGMSVNTSGVLIDNPTATYYGLDLTQYSESDITISGVTPFTSGSHKFYSFQDASGNVLSFGHIDDTSGTTLAIPSGAAVLYFTTTYSGDSTSILDTIMLNLGESALPYADFQGQFLSEVDGEKVQTVDTSNFYDKQQVDSLLPEFGEVVAGNNVMTEDMIKYGALIISSTGLMAVQTGTPPYWTLAWGVPFDPTRDFTIKGWNTAAVAVVSAFTGALPDLGANPTSYNSAYLNKTTVTKSGGAVTIPANTFGSTATWLAFSAANNTETETVYENLIAGIGSDVTPGSDTYVDKVNNTAIAATVLLDESGKAFSVSDLINTSSAPVKLTIDPNSAQAGAVLEYNILGKSIIHTLAAFRPWSFTDSNVFDFRGLTINGVNVHTEVDEVSPLQAWLTDIGANHSFTGMNVTCTGHGKTFQDVGSKWTTGSIELMLMSIPDANHLQFSRTNSNGSVSSITTLSHVAGATNTSNITGTSTVVQRTCPCIQNRTLDIYVDGKKVEAIAASHYGKEVKFVEYYEIMDKQSIMDWLFTQVGKSTAITEFHGTSVFGLNLTYIFDDNLGCTITYEVIALQDASPFQSVLGAQSNPLIASADYPNLKWYIPKVLPKTWMGSTQDLTKPTAVPSTVTEALVYTPDEVESTGILADRTLQLLDGFGLAQGFIPVLDGNTDNHRDNAVTRVINISTSKKHYSISLHRPDITSLSKGDTWSFVLYKNYFFRDSSRTAMYFPKFNGNTYMYCDWHIDTIDAIPLPDGLIGREFEVIEKSANVNILSKAGAGRILVSAAASDSYGYMILKF